MSKTATLDRRALALPGLEVRGLKGSGVEITGMPIVYDQPYTVRDGWGEFEETMRPGVVSGVISRCDCRFLYNHDGMPLARTTSGTMQLIDTPTGLSFVAKLDKRQALAADLLIAIERGDVSQMSCGFIVDPTGDEWSADSTQRSIYRFADLLDVSAVCFPASPTTSIQLAN